MMGLDYSSMTPSMWFVFGGVIVAGLFLILWKATDTMRNES